MDSTYRRADHERDFEAIKFAQWMMNVDVHLRSNFPNVATLMGGYLHEDFDRESGSVDGAVRAFIDVSTRSECVAFARESSIFLASYDDPSLEAVLDRMGNAFDYLSIGLTSRTSLEGLAAQISDAIESPTSSS